MREEKIILEQKTKSRIDVAAAAASIIARAKFVHTLKTLEKIIAYYPKGCSDINGDTAAEIIKIMSLKFFKIAKCHFKPPKKFYCRRI